MTLSTATQQDRTASGKSRGFAANRAFSGFSSDDLQAARDFYEGKLGLDVELQDDMLTLRFPGGQRVLIYPKENHQPATFTVLNIEVDDIEAAVDGLIEAGIELERYGPDFDQDARGIARKSEGQPIAWFEDPSGNILSVIETGHEGGSQPLQAS